MSLPEVSVIIPTYNGSRFIADALRSVFAQTYLPREIIVVDDCSTDSTLEVVEQLLVESPVPVKVVRLEKNSGGPARPLNTGIAVATADVIAILEQDDLFLEDKLLLQCGVLAASDEIVLVGGHAGVLHSSGQFCMPCRWPEAIRGARIEGTAAWKVKGSAAEQLYRIGMFLNGFPGYVFWRESWVQVGGIDERLCITADYDLACRIAATGTVAMVDRVMYVHCRHGANLSRRTDLMRVETARVRAKLVTGSYFPGAELALDDLRSEVVNMAYLMREGGKYGPARDLLQLAGELGYPLRGIAKRLWLIRVHQCLNAMGLWKLRDSSLTRGHVWEVSLVPNKKELA